MKLKDLAQSLGLSQTTVSRALNGYPEVAEATRRRVQAAAAAHNYTPDTRARGLATGRAMVVGHVIPVSDQHEIVNPVFADFIAGAGEIYRQNGYGLALSTVEDGEEPRVYGELAARGAVDGIILHAPRIRDSRIALLQRIGLPFVVHGRVSAGPNEAAYDWVDVDNRRAFRRATEYLLDLGHRRVALINGQAEMDFAARRTAGYRAALAARGLAFDPTLVFSAPMTEAHGHAATLAALRRDRPVTAILAASMILALGVRRAAHEAGLTIPDDLSVVAHDDELSYLRNGDAAPIFTATRSSVRQAGRLCALRLMELVQDPGQAPCQRLLEADLTLGRSTGPAPNRIS